MGGDPINVGGHFRVVKNPRPVNSKTGFVPEEDTYYIVWDNGNVGRLQFVRGEYYNHVPDEWKDFKDELMTYDPLDYDTLNDYMIFDIEHGKRLMDDYTGICNRTMEAMKKRITKVELEKAKAIVAKLETQVEE